MKTTLSFQVFAVVLAISLQQTLNAQSWLTTGNSGTTPNTNFVGTTDNKALAVRTNNVERMRIKTNGNVGIGITSPVAKLQVDNGDFVSLSLPGFMVVGNTTNYNLAFDGNEVQARYNGAGSTLYLDYWGGDVWLGNHNGSTVPALYAASDGRVGIGASTITAGYALTVNPSSAGNGITINDPAGGYLALGTKSGSTGEGLRMNISSTTNPYAAVRGHTDGNGYGVLAEATGTYGFGVEGYSSQSYGVWGGTGNSSSYAGYFSGDVYSSGSYFGSDQNLKQNIVELTSGMSVISQLHPKQYQFRQDGNYKLMNLPQGKHYGLIAQEIEKVLPTLVKDTKFLPGKAGPSSNGEESKNPEIIEFKALNYTELIPIMIKGMQEQQQQIDELKKMVEKLGGNANTSKSL